MTKPSKSESPRDARAELIASGRELFLTHGYAKTSVDRINRDAGLSKGTFYHYFHSKSDLLDAIVEQLTDEGWSNSKTAMADDGAGALARFRRFMKAARRWRIIALPQTAAIMRAVFRPENSLLRERMRARSISLALRGLSELIADGNREGVFCAPDPDAAARVFMTISYAVSDDMVCEVMRSTASDEELLAQLVARGRAFMRCVEAILGVERESLGEPEEELLAGMVRAFRSESPGT